MPRQKNPKKPRKPKPDFPLTPHDRGRWCKKIRSPVYPKGKMYYFGSWDDPGEALKEYLQIRDDLQAGIDPRKQPRTTGITIKDLCDQYLHSQRGRANEGDISERSYQERFADATKLSDVLGRSRTVESLQPVDFARLRVEVSNGRGLVSLRNTLVRIRGIFRWGHKSKLMAMPMQFGPDFDLPKRDAMRRAKNVDRQKHGARMFSAEELRTIIEASDVVMKAMILLGINCGYGQTDCSSVPVSAFDLSAGIVDFPRPKTAADRRCPLWPETVSAICDAIKNRSAPKDTDDSHLAFLTRFGGRWVRTNAKGTPDDELGKEFSKLLTRLNLKRPGVGFYALRHTFETIGGESRDQVAVNCIMGHIDHSMAANYREHIGDGRLRAVTDHVRYWLFPPKPKKKPAKKKVAAKQQ